MMLEEWQRISEGYSFVGAEGETVGQPERRRTAGLRSALETVSRAVATGRLEVAFARATVTPTFPSWTLPGSWAM